MATMNINIQIKDANQDLVNAAINDKFPKPEEYTQVQWNKEVLREQIYKWCLEFKEKKGMEIATEQANAIIETAKNSINVPDNITE